MPDVLFPPPPLLASHQLDVGDGQRLYVEECGRRGGLPVAFLHGGPGSGCAVAHRRFFDPQRFHVVLHDQRGCGRSVPLARPDAALTANSTDHLIADLERIRAALGIERWLVCGGSWGSLLALAYAQAHPGRVLGLVLRGVFLGSRGEIEAYRHSLQRNDPAAWRHFLEATPGLPGVAREDLLPASLARLGAPVTAGVPRESELFLRAARLWLGYEALLMGEAFPPSRLRPQQVAKARIQGHYLAHDCFIDDVGLLAGCALLTAIPTAIVQGLADPVCPPAVASRLHAAMPEAQWLPVLDAGHGGFEQGIAAAFVRALALVAARIGDRGSPAAGVRCSA